MHSQPQRKGNQGKAIVVWLLKVGIVACCFFYIHDRLASKSWDAVFVALSTPKFLWASGIVFLLTPINWYLEALKWKRSLMPVCDMATGEAFNAVLRGLSLNWVLPFSLGDFVGRVLGLPKTLTVVNVILQNRVTALCVTLGAGLMGTIYIFQWPLWTWVLVPLTFLIPFAIGHIRKVKLYNPFGMGALLGLTLVRYFIFSFQFGLLLAVAVPGLTLEVVVAGVAVVFLVRSIIPSILGAIGIREAATIWVFGAFTSDIELLTCASLTLWVANIVVPSIFGLIPFFGLKLKWAR